MAKYFFGFLGRHSSLLRPIEIAYDSPRRRKSGTLVSAELLFSRNCILFAKTVLLRREREPNARMEHKRQVNRCQESELGSTCCNSQTLCFQETGRNPIPRHARDFTSSNRSDRTGLTSPTVPA
jgi:hypothetical protein